MKWIMLLAMFAGMQDKQVIYPYPVSQWSEPVVVPVDVPAIQEEYGNPGCYWSDMGENRWFEGSACGDHPKRCIRLTCADKSRILLTAEDGTKHCVKFKTEVAK